MTLRTRTVDERDSRSEIDFPVFRVYLWSRQPAPSGVDPAMTGYENDAYEVTGGDVHEVVAWAEEQARPDRTYTLFACCDDSSDPHGIRLIRLAGVEPTHPDDDAEYFGFRPRP